MSIKNLVELRNIKRITNITVFVCDLCRMAVSCEMETEGSIIKINYRMSELFPP